MKLTDWVGLALLATTTACGAVHAQSGTPFDKQQALAIKRGEDNKDTIKGRFGSPYQATLLSKAEPGCSDAWLYSHAHGTLSEMHADALVVVFDDNGLVCRTEMASR